MQLKESVYIICRPSTKGRALEQSLSTHGLAARCLPAIECSPIISEEDQHELNYRLNAGEYSGVVLTSPTAVELLAELSIVLPDQVSLFAQSRATIGLIKQLLARDASCSPERFTSEALAELLANCEQGSRKLCFLAAKVTSGGFLRRAKELGLTVDYWPFYETQLLSYSQSTLDDLHANFSVVNFISHSPSAVQSVSNSYRACPHLLETCRFFSIGPKTSAAVTEMGLRLIAEATEPSDLSMVDVIMKSLGTPKY